MSADASELRDFGLELTGLEPKVAKAVNAVVFKGATNIKKGMKSSLENSTHFAPVARSIDFDMNVSSEGIEAEIGPNPDQHDSARLANIAYFGSSVGVYRGGPKWSLEVGRGPAKGGNSVDLMRPFEEEAPRFETAMGKVMRDVL